MNATLAELAEPEQFEFVASKVKHYNTNSLWWTALELRHVYKAGQYDFRAYWPAAGLPVASFPEVLNQDVSVRFFAPPYFFMKVHLEPEVQFICEKVWPR